MFNSHIHLDFNNELNCLGIVPSIGKQNWDKVKFYQYFALGIHPWFIDLHNLDDIDNLTDKIITLKPIAIGEIGLDFSQQILAKNSKNSQIEFFTQQLNLAQKYNLPVIIHIVKSYDEVINILKNYTLKVQIHSFNGSQIQGQKLINLGAYLSFGLAKKSIKLQEFIKIIPLDKILIETDEKPNSQLKLVATEIANLRQIPLQKLIKITTENTIKLFNIKDE